MSSTEPDLTTAYVPFRETMRRLEELRRAMPTGVTADLNDETLLAIEAGLQRVKRGTR